MQKEMGVVLLGREGRVSSIVYDRAGSNACMRLLANNKKKKAQARGSLSTGYLFIEKKGTKKRKRELNKPHLKS